MQSTPPSLETKKNRAFVPISVSQSKNPWGKSPPKETKESSSQQSSPQDFPTLDASKQLSKRDLKQIQQERHKKLHAEQEELRKQREEEKAAAVAAENEKEEEEVTSPKQSFPQKMDNPKTTSVTPSSKRRFNFRRDYGNNRVSNRRNGRRGSSRRGRGNRGDYRGRGKRFKTEICVNFEQGNCAFGDRCCFAHGESDMNERPVGRPTLYKTMPCKVFFELQYCPHGDECNFYHDESERIYPSPRDPERRNSNNTSTNKKSRGGYRGRGGHKRNNRDNNFSNNMHGMNINQYYSNYFAAQQGYYFPMNANPHGAQSAAQQLMMQQMAAAQAQSDMMQQMAANGAFANQQQFGHPNMMGFPQQMMQNPHNNGMPMLQQTNIESEGTSEQPEQHLADENVLKNDNNDENESNGETKSVSDTGNSSSASLSGMSSSNGTTNHVIPKTLLHGVVVCNKPMEIMAEQEEVGIPEGPYISLVVECVATGTTHNDRAVAHVALVDENRKVELNIYIKPEDDVVSYLQLITQLDKETIDKYGFQADEAMRIIRESIPPNCCLVGHNVARHIGRLGLKKGVHFRDFLDVKECWRVWNKNFSDYTKFSLNHESSVLLNLRSSGHVPNDAILQMRVLQLYMAERHDPEQLHTRRKKLMATPVERAIHKRFPVIDGVCLGLRKNCQCGSPFTDWT